MCNKLSSVKFPANMSNATKQIHPDSKSVALASILWKCKTSGIKTHGILKLLEYKWAEKIKH